MDQGSIATVKAIYKKLTFAKAHETHETLAELTSNQLSELILNFELACDFAKENDPNEARSSKIIKNVLDDIKCYKLEAKEKEELKNPPRQTSVNDFFSPK